MAEKIVRRMYVTIYDDTGAAYGDTGDNKAIVIYAKHLNTEDALESYPYNWWEEDGMVGGTVALATMTYNELGQWYYDMESDTLDTEKSAREDYYIVKTGTSATYLGYDDNNWDVVTGYDPKPFQTYIPTALDFKDLLNNTFKAAKFGTNRIDMDNLPDGFMVEDVSSEYIDEDLYSFSVTDIAEKIGESTTVTIPAISASLVNNKNFMGYVASVVAGLLDA